MPKQTFFNLEPEKRQGIIAAAVREFAEHPFAQAYLTKIVESSGIAKGSNYQNFEDKLDLNLYIVHLAYEQKKAYVGRAISMEGDIFAVLSEYYRLSYQFALDPPLLHKVANKFWDSRSAALRAELEQGRLSRSRDFARVLAAAMAAGKDNRQLEPEAGCFVNTAEGKALLAQFHQGCNDEILQKVLNDMI